MKAFTFLCLAASLLISAQCGSRIKSIGRRIAISAIAGSNPLGMKHNHFHKGPKKHLFPIPVVLPVPYGNRRIYPQEPWINTTSSVQSETTTAEPTTVQDNDKSTTVGASTVSKSPEELRQKLKEQVESLIDSCKTQNKITPEQAKIATDAVVPKTEAEKCFLECIYNGLSLTKDGAFNEIGAKMLALQRFATSPDELAKANAMIETCTKEAVVKDTNEKCALGRLIRECFVKHGAKIQFFPKP